MIIINNAILREATTVLPVRIIIISMPTGWPTSFHGIQIIYCGSVIFSSGTIVRGRCYRDISGDDC